MQRSHNLTKKLRVCRSCGNPFESCKLDNPRCIAEAKRTSDELAKDRAPFEEKKEVEAAKPPPEEPEEVPVCKPVAMGMAPELKVIFNNQNGEREERLRTACLRGSVICSIVPVKRFSVIPREL